MSMTPRELTGARDYMPVERRREQSEVVVLGKLDDR